MKSCVMFAYVGRWGGFYETFLRFLSVWNVLAREEDVEMSEKFND